MLPSLAVRYTLVWLRRRCSANFGTVMTYGLGS
jgi:hypothetical protein